MRLRIFAVTAAAVLTAAVGVVSPASPASAIVGGTTATQRYPFLVNLTLAGTPTVPDLHRCGASLVTALWAVTAAHCVQGPPMQDLIARVGSNDRTAGGEVRTVTKVVLHEKYELPSEAVALNDIALIELSAPVSATPISLATRAPQPGTRTRIMGWGAPCNQEKQACYTRPIMLRQLDTMITDPGHCSAIGNPDTDLCTGDPAAQTGACSGDSGGPQITTGRDGRWELVGITSRTGNGSYTCAQNPSIYTSVAAYISWITTHLPPTTPATTGP